MYKHELFFLALQFYINGYYVNFNAVPMCLNLDIMKNVAIFSLFMNCLNKIIVLLKL